MKQMTVLLFACAAIGLASLTAAAQEASEAWQPVAPAGLPTGFDWIRLPSDEWLKGEIISMDDDVLKFESDKLDELTFDFDDIKELRLARVVQAGFEKGEPAIGELIIDGDMARVIGDTGEVQFDRAEILSIIVGASKEGNYWSGHADVGSNIRSGNTDQTDYTARLGMIRRTVKNRVGFKYLGNITRINSEDTSNNHRANLG